MPELDLPRIREVRHHLLALHKLLLDHERAAYERSHGRIAPADYLGLLIDDAAFAWLRPMTELIVRIDEWLDDDARAADAGIAWLDEIARLLAPDPALHEFHERYAAMLQASPDVVLAHRAVTQALTARGS
jgi:hypothetical protein